VSEDEVARLSTGRKSVGREGVVANIRGKKHSRFFPKYYKYYGPEYLPPCFVSGIEYSLRDGKRERTRCHRMDVLVSLTKKSNPPFIQVF